jgi:hypothetical protein
MRFGVNFPIAMGLSFFNVSKENELYAPYTKLHSQGRAERHDTSNDNGIKVRQFLVVGYLRILVPTSCILDIR